MKKLIFVIVAFIFIPAMPQTNIIVPQMIERHDFTFGGDRDDIYSALWQDNSYVIAGRRALVVGQTNSNIFAYLGKYSSQGDLLWEIVEADSTYSTGANSIARAPNDGVFWAVTALGGYGTGEKPAVYRIDKDGNIVWKKVLPKSASFDGIIGAIASDDDYLIVAQGKNNQKILIFNHNGELLFDPWHISLESINGLIVKDNNLYISGINPGGIVSNYHSEFYKTDLQGNVIWADTLQVDMMRPWTTFDDNEYLYLTGRHWTPGIGQWTANNWIRTVRYDKESGQRVWEKLWNGDPPNQLDLNNCNPWFITAHPEGGCVITGYIQKIGAVDKNSTDAGVISYDADGNERFKIRYDYEPNWFMTDFRSALFDGNTLVTFGVAVQDLNPNFEIQLYLCKWNNVTSVTPEPGILTDYQLYQNYPNPFNPTTTIKFSTPLGAHCVLKVFNLLGQEMETLVDEYLPSGNYSAQFAGQNLPSGIYIYELRTENFSTAKKMTVIK